MIFGEKQNSQKGNKNYKSQRIPKKGIKIINLKKFPKRK